MRCTSPNRGFCAGSAKSSVRREPFPVNEHDWPWVSESRTVVGFPRGPASRCGAGARCPASRCLPQVRRREPRHLTRLNSPNPARPDSAEEKENPHYLVMEYGEGVNLPKLVKRMGRLPVPEACPSTMEAARGLQQERNPPLLISSAFV